jgi:hypothetical protein
VYKDISNVIPPQWADEMGDKRQTIYEVTLAGKKKLQINNKQPKKEDDGSVTGNQFQIVYRTVVDMKLGTDKETVELLADKSADEKALSEDDDVKHKEQVVAMRETAGNDFSPKATVARLVWYCLEKKQVDIAGIGIPAVTLEEPEKEEETPEKEEDNSSSAVLGNLMTQIKSRRDLVEEPYSYTRTIKTIEATEAEIPGTKLVENENETVRRVTFKTKRWSRARRQAAKLKALKLKRRDHFITAQSMTKEAFDSWKPPVPQFNPKAQYYNKIRHEDIKKQIQEAEEAGEEVILVK